MKTVCLITPGHISSNPRLVKEAMALSAEGYKIHLVFTQYLISLVGYDQDILAKNPGWNYSITDWTGRSFSSVILRKYSAAKQKLRATLLLYFSRNSLLVAHNLNRHLTRQYKQAVKTKAGLYIAHNLGALAVAVFAAEKTGAKAGFDAEDFHRNELHDGAHKDVLLKSCIEDAFIPKTHFFTASSQQIADAYEKLYPKINPVIVRNVFPKTSLKKNSAPPFPLKLFWFSQTIGLDRGIEQILQAIHICGKKNIELHLLGSITDAVKNGLQNEAEKLNLIQNLFFHNPVAPHELFTLAARFHIGMATETGIPLNRELCLTNKLFTYIQCGLAVIASETHAQKAFLKEHPGVGKTYAKNNPAKLAEVLLFYFNNPEKLWQTCESNARVGQLSLNWEQESRKLIASVKNCL